MARLGLLVLFAAGTLAAPFMVLDEHLPRAQLKDDGCSNLRFPPKGQQFTHDYAGETLSVVAGSSERKTGMKITAEISIAAVSKCSFVLEVSKAELSSKSATDANFAKTTAENAKFKQEIEKFGLRFDLGANGEIESLHAHQLEPTHILNMKRGIVSQLQLDVNGQVETDVNGICDMEIASKDGKIIKTKDLSKCSKRAVNEIGLQSTSVQSESNMKPLASTSKCIYEVNDKNIKSVLCEETHIFRPFSAGYKSASGAITTVKQTLAYKNTRKITRKIDLTELSVTSTLAFDHENENFSAANTITQQVETIMSKLVQKTPEGGFVAQQSSAREFQNLVTVLRKMDDKRLAPVYNQYIDCINSGLCKPDQTDLRDVYRQFLLDAVTYCGTPTCISMIRDVIINGQISGERMNMFLQGIALVGKTDVNMVRDVLLIAKKAPSRQAFLTLGTLIFRQCSRNEQDCHYNAASPISQAESFLEEILGKECEKQKNHEDLEQILMALKAIGNAGRPISAFKKVLNCGIKSQHGNLTVAAFDALRRMPCDHKRSEMILAFVSDEDACPEKRSHAFKALVKCPDEQILHKLVHRLELEPSKQLGSFMWTTLTNIMESSDTKHALCQQYLEKILAGKSLKEINMPMHQFSKNYEKSFMLNKLDTGVTAEGDLIFNPQGYLPRSAFFNLTANVMGVPVHIVEASAQVNGMETLLEDVFGPEGMFPDNTVFKMFNFTLTKEKLMDMANKRNQRQDNEFVNRRSRRSAANSIDENLKDLHKRVNNKRDIPSGSLSFKVMGHEIRAFSYDDLFWAIDKIDNMNVITMLLNIAKGGKKTFSKSMLFLEMTHSVPTGLGLPLKLKLVGSTVSSIELNGKFDIRNMFWGPSSMTIKGSVKPSASVEVTGQMGIFSHFVDTGLYVSNTMHTSQFLKGAIVYKQGQMLKVNVDTPDEPVQLFNFSSTPYMFLNEKSVLIEGAERKINPDFCTKSVVLGFGLCTSLRVPVAYRDYEAPYYPLSGPSHFGMKLVKADEKLTTYEFLAKLSKKGDITNGIISLSTPGATYERKAEGDMTYAVDGNLHTLTIGSSNALGSNGKRTELEVSYDTASHSVKMGAKSDLLTKSFLTYDFSMFNETNPAGRAFGVRSTFAYDKYKYSAESKVVKTKTGALLMSSASYYPGKTVTATLEFNSISNKVFARFDADQFKQLALDFSGQYIRRGSYKGIVLTGQHVMSGKKASLSGGLDDGKLIITGDLNGKSAKTVITVTSKKVGVMVEAVGNKGELAVTLDSKQFAKILALQAIVNGKGAKLTATVDYKSDKIMTIDVDVLGKKASSTIGLYTPGKDISIKASVTAAGQTVSTAAGYYVKDGKKTWKWEGDAIGHHMELYTNYLVTENKIVDTGAVFDKYVAGFRSVYSTKKGNSLCSSMYYSIGKREVEPFVGCVRYIDFAHDHDYIHKELVLSADMKTINQNLETKIILESHPGHTVVKSTFSQNGNEKGFATLDSLYGDMKNAQTKLTVGSGKKTMSAACFSKKEGNNQNVGVKYQVLDKSIAFISKFISKSNDWAIANVIQINGKDLPVSSSIRYYQGLTSGTELTMTVRDISVIYASTFKNGVPDKSVSVSLSLTKAGKELLSVYKNSILTWSQKKKSFEQQFGAMISGNKYQYGYTFQLLDRSSISKSAISVGFILAYSNTRSNSITLMFANGKQTTEFHANIEYLPGSHLKQIIVFNKQDKKLDISFEILPKMFVKYSAKLDKLNGIKLSHDLSLQIDNAQKSVQKGYKNSVQWVNEYIKSAKNLRMATNIGKHLSVSFENKNAKSSVASLRILTTKAEFITTYIPARNGIMFRFLLNNKEQFSATAEIKNGKAALALSRGKSELEFLGFYIKSQNKITMNINLNEKSIIGMSMKKAGNSLSFKVKTAGSTVEIVGKKEGLGLFLKFNMNNKMIVQFAAQADKKAKTLTLSSDTGKRICGLRMRADYVNLVTGVEGFCNKHVIGWEAAIKDNSLTIELSITPTKSIMVTFEIEADRVIKITVTRKTGINKFDEFTTTVKLTPEMFKLAFNLNKNTINNLAKNIFRVADVAQNKVRKISRRSVDAVMETVKNVDIKTIKKQGEKAADLIANFEDLVTKYVNNLELKEMITKARAATKYSLEKVSKTLEQLKRKMPGIVKQVTEVMDTIKSQIKSQINSIDIGYIKSFAKEQLKELAKYNKVLAKKVEILAAQLKRIAKRITKSSRPVIAKVIKQVQNFKIRGETLASIAKLVIKKGEKYVAVYVKLAKGVLKTLTKEGQMLIRKGKVFIKNGTGYVMTMKLPLCGGRKTEQCIKSIVKNFKNMRKQLNTAELKKMVDKVQAVVEATMEENLKQVNVELKKISAIAREALTSSIKITRQYLKEIEQYKKHAVKYEKLSKKALNQAIKTLKEMGVEVSEFLKPLTNYARTVVKSVQKNFGPLARKSAQQINKYIHNINLDMNLRPIIMKRLRVIEKVLLPLVKPITPLYNKLMTQIRQLQILGVKFGPMFDMKLKELQTYLDKYIQEGGTEMTKILKDLNKLAGRIGKMSPEMMVDIAFDQGDKLIVKVVKEVQTAYKQRKVIMEKTLTKAMQLYKQLKDLSEKLNQKSVKTAMDMLFKESGKILTKTSEELKQLADQIAKLDIANHAMKTWKDVIGQLKSNGINQKIIDAIEAAKKMDPSKDLLQLVKELEKKFNELKEAAIVKAMIVYNKAQKAQKYIKSIPKKSYDEWFKEMQKFAISNKMEIINYFQTMYGVSKIRAETIFKAFNSLKLNNVDYNKAMDKYVKPMGVNAQKLGEDIMERGRRVRRDIEEPTIALKELYTEKVSKFSNDKYEMMYNRVIEMFNRMRTIVNNNFKAVSKDVIAAYVEVTGKIMDKLEMVWTRFNKNYGHMTWEQIGDDMYKAGKKQSLVVKEITNAKIQYLMGLLEKLKLVTKNAYSKVKAEYKQAIDKAIIIYRDLNKKSIIVLKDLIKKAQTKYAELKPKVIAGIEMITKEANKYQLLFLAKIQDLRGNIAESIKQWKEMVILGKSMAIMMYEQNKQKTLRQVYTDLKTIGTSIVQAQYDMIMVRINAKLTSMNAIYKKYLVVWKKSMANMQTYVPEIKKEIVSITNQLIQGYTEISQEIALQFSPQFKAVKKEVMKMVQLFKAKVEEIKAFVKPLMAADYEQIKKEMQIMAKDKYDELVIYIKQLVAQMKNKFDNMDFTEIKKLQAKVDDIVKLAKDEFIKIQKNSVLRERIQNLKKLAMKKLNEVKNNPTLIKAKKMVEEKIKLIEKSGKNKYNKFSKLAINEYKRSIKEYKQKIAEIRNSPTFVRAMQTLKKLQKSADFTINKLASKITPLLKKLIRDLTLLIEATPATCIKAYEQFKKSPEETFWATIDIVSRQSKIAMAEAKKLKASDLKTAMKNGQTTFIKLADECTDDYAKATVKQLLKQTNKAAKVMQRNMMELKRDVKQTLRRARREAPIMAKKYMKKATKEANRAMNQLKKNALVAYDKALKPIVENQIWGEISDEINNHEITKLVRELVKLIKQGAEVLVKETKIIYNKAVARATIYYTQVSAKTIALWKENFPKFQKKFEEINNKFEDVKKQVVSLWKENFPKLQKKFEEINNKFEEVKKQVVSSWKTKFPVFMKKLNELKKLCTVKCAELNKIGLKIIADMKIKYAEFKIQFSALKKELAKFDLKKTIDLFKKKATDLVDSGTKTLAELNKIIPAKFEELKKITIAKFEELKKITIANVEKMKKVILANVDQLKNKAVALYNKSFKDFNNFLDTTKLIDIENFVRKSIHDTKKVIKSVTAQLVYLKNNYKQIAKKYYSQTIVLAEQYKAQTMKTAMALINKYRPIVMSLAKKYKAEALKLVTAYKPIVMSAIKDLEVKFNKYKMLGLKMYKEYKTLGLEMYNKYKNIGLKMYKEYKTLALASLKKYKIVVTKLFNEYKNKATVLLNKLNILYQKYQMEALKMYNKYKPIVTKLFNEYTNKATVLLNKLNILYQKYQTEALKMYNKYKPIVINFFKDYENQVIAMIKNIEVFLNKYKTSAIAMYNKYKPIAIAMYKKYTLEAIKQFNFLKTKSIKLYNLYKPKFVAKYEECVKKITAQVLRIYNAYKPQVEVALKRCTTLIIMYKAEFVKIYKTLLKDASIKTQKLIAIYKPKIEAFIKKVQVLITNYKSKVQKLANTYKPIVEDFLQNNLKQVMKYKTEAMKLMEQYKKKVTAIVEPLVLKAKTEVDKLINTYKTIVEDFLQKNLKLAMKYKTEALKLMEQYKKKITAIVKPLVLKARTEVDKLITIYKPKIMALVKKIQTLVLVKYNTLVAPIINKYTPIVNGYIDNVKQIVDIFKQEAMETYNTYATKVIVTFRKYEEVATVWLKFGLGEVMKLRSEALKAIAEFKDNPKKAIEFVRSKIMDLVKFIRNQIAAIDTQKMIQDLKVQTLLMVQDLKIQTFQMKTIAIKMFKQYKSEFNVFVNDLKARWTKCMTACQKKLNILIKFVSSKVAVINTKTLEIKTWVEKTIKNPEPLKKLLLAKAMEIKETVKKNLLELNAEIEKLVKVIRAKAIEIKSKVEKQIATFDADKLTKQLINKALEIKATTQKSVLKLKAMIEKFVKVIRAKAIEIKSKVEKQIAKFDADKMTKQLINKALEIKKIVKKEITKIAMDLKFRAEKCVVKCKAKAQVYVKNLKLKAQMIKLQAQKQISIIKAQIEKIIADLSKQTTELQSKVIKTWEKSSLRKGLTTLKKMTVSETILAIKNLPAKAKKFVIAEYNKIRAIVEAEFAKKYGKAIELYKELYAKALGIYQEKYAQALALYNRISAKAMVAYKKEYERVLLAYKKILLKFKALKGKIIFKLNMLKNDIASTAMPAYIELKKVALAATNEIKETAIFSYKYYNIQKTIDMIKNKIMTEYKRIDPMVRRMIIEFFEMLKKELESYKSQGEELLKIYKKQGMTNMEEYKKFAVKSLKKNFSNAKVASVKLAKSTGHTMLRGVHSGMVAIDNIDTTKLKRQARSITTKTLTTINKYVDLDTNNMVLRINIPHGGAIKSTFTKNVKYLKRQVQTMNIRARRAMKVAQKEVIKQADRVQRAVESVRRKAMQSKLVKDARQVVKQAQRTVTDVRNRITEKSMTIYEKIMRETTGIRRDLAMIFKADRQLVNRIIAEIKQLSTMYWRKAVTRFNTYKIKAMFQYKKALKAAQAYITKAKKMTAATYKQGEQLAMIVYNNPEATFQKALTLVKQGLNNAEKLSIDVYNNPSKTYNYAIKVVKRAVQIFRMKIINAYRQNAPIAKLMARKYYIDLQMEMNNLQKQTLKAVMPYYNAIMRIKGGESPAKVIQPFIKQVKKLMIQARLNINKYSQKTKRAVCTYDRIFCRLVAQSFNVNKMVMDKYANKMFKMLMFAKVQSDRSYRQTRVMLSNLGEKSSTLAAPTYQAVGMIFGKSHVVTFDQKYYDFIDYKAPDCTYVLARDFTDGKFTIMSQEGKIIVKTPGMTVKIGADGKTKTTIDGKTTESLPVKSDTGVCMRYGDFIKCYFMEQKFKVTVDLKHFAAVIGLSGWHHGKTQGLLGTNNHESYDEWKMPNGKITSDIYELANAYEVTQKIKCVAKPVKIQTPACNKRPSRRCEELFASKTSQYARLFSKINPEAFLKACQADSADCDTSFPYETSHCNATAAFVMYARAQWNYAAMPIDCNTYQGHKVGSTWTQKPLKRAVDVVVLVSERTTVGPVRNLFAKTVSNINLRLARTGYKNVRFALVGFGGHDVHEKAHVHPLNGKIFAKMPALAKEIKSMPYSGAGQDTNDAYHAILKASSMKFRPGASRVFIMYNTVPHVSHEHGPTYDEAMHALVNEANATLFVLDKLVFKNLKKHTIIGQSNGKMYTDDSTILPLPEVELPASEFKQMVKSTNGGLFSNKIRKSKIQRFAQSMFKGMSVWLKKDSQLCKKCSLSQTWYGIPVPVCVATAC